MEVAQQRQGCPALEPVPESIGWGPGKSESPGRARDEEGLMASLASDLLTEIRPPGAPGRTAARAGYEDSIRLGQGAYRCHVRDDSARVGAFLGHERVGAVFATYLLAEINTPDL
jgi:hypothetical protein